MRFYSKLPRIALSRKNSSNMKNWIKVLLTYLATAIAAADHGQPKLLTLDSDINHSVLSLISTIFLLFE